MKTQLAICMVSLGFMGCATAPQQTGAEQAFYAMQKQEQKPLFHLEVVEGQALTGLKSITVHVPPNNQGIVQYKKPEHAGLSALREVTGVLRIAAPIYFGGEAAIGLANVVGKHVGNASTQPVTTNINDSYNATDNSQFNSGRIDSDDLINSGRIDSSDDYTHDPVVVNQPEPIVVNQPPYNDPIIIQ